MLRSLGLAPLALVFTVTVGFAAGARAQGAPDPRTGVVLPNPQSAAVEDATSILVNPAGLAHLEGLEVNLGGFLATDGRVGQSDVDGIIAVSPGAGFGLGVGAGLTSADGDVPRLRTTAALAVGADRAASLGIAVHDIFTLAGGGRGDVQFDVGSQFRPARWLAFGAALDGLGARVDPASARLGVSVRPLDELLTLGLDAQIIPGSRDITSPRYGDVAVVPALAARLDFGGIAFTVGASAKDIAFLGGGPTANVAILAGIELNGQNLGLAALGGVDGVGTGTQSALGGVRIRSSTAAYPGLFPDSGRWLSLSLTKDGVPVDEGSGLVHDLFSDKPQALAILTALHNIADDNSVEGLVIHIKGVQLGWGRLAEIRSALEKVKASGKKVIVHMDGGDDGDVYLASVADKVYLTPSGQLELNGLRAEMMYFGDTLEKIGIEAEAVSAGRYKSAPRAFTANEPSPEELEVENALLDGVFKALVSMVAKGRNISEDAVKAAIDKGGLTSKAALDAKIVDELCYEDELDKKVEAIAGRPVHFEEHFMDREEHDVRWDEQPRIALIPLQGEITMGRGGGSLFSAAGAGSDAIIEAVNRAAEDNDVKAIVLRIDSPGGDALASDLIWHAVMKARDKKPVVASMGDVAASGGYYVASAANTIYAEENTITGSIGVFGLMFNGERLADKIGVRTYSLERGALPGPSALRGLSDGERAALQGSVNNTYEQFLQAVVDGRGKVSGLDKEAVRKIAEGHVWNGTQAKERKLVDTIGGIGEALLDAKKRAGLDADEDVGLDIITGHAGDDLLKLGDLARALAPQSAEAEAVAQAARLLLGDPAALSFALASEGRPLAVAPMTVHVH